MKRIFKLLSVLAGLVCLVSLAALFQFRKTYQKSEQEYAEVAQEAVQVKQIQNPAEGFEAEPEVPPLLSVDFEKLKAQNNEICAWIDFPGQNKSYPVVQSDNNEYYLNHSFRGAENSCGSIFADCRNQGILEDANTVLYGHNMRNLSMFGFLRNYQKEEHFKRYPYFDLYLPDGTYRCRLLACRRVEADWSNFPIQFESEAARNSFLAEMQRYSPYRMNEPDKEEERPLVMLSTCIGRGHTHRLVVLAEAYEEVADAEKETE